MPIEIIASENESVTHSYQTSPLLNFLRAINTVVLFMIKTFYTYAQDVLIYEAYCVGTTIFTFAEGQSLHINSSVKLRASAGITISVDFSESAFFVLSKIFITAGCLLSFMRRPCVSKDITTLQDNYNTL